MIVVVFCGVLMCSAAVGFLAALALQKRGVGWLGVPLFAVVMVVCAAWLDRIPAPVASQQELVETATAWPTETAWPESGLKDWIDVLLVNDEQQNYRLGVVETVVAGCMSTAVIRTVTPSPTAIPTVTPTGTAVSKLCQTCEVAADCDLNQTCYQCGQDKGWRCVWTILRNGTCTQCINVGR
jgi:hypothetical protein